jgi:hypothetical protein
MLFLPIILSTLSLLVLPVANNQIYSVVELYSDAERALDSLIAEAGWLPITEERRDVLSRLRDYATVLQTFKEADQLRATSLGIPVTWYVSRDVVNI